MPDGGGIGPGASWVGLVWVCGEIAARKRVCVLNSLHWVVTTLAGAGERSSLGFVCLLRRTNEVKWWIALRGDRECCLGAAYGYCGHTALGSARQVTPARRARDFGDDDDAEVRIMRVRRLQTRVSGVYMPQRGVRTKKSRVAQREAQSEARSEAQGLRTLGAGGGAGVAQGWRRLRRRCGEGAAQV